MKIKYYSFQKQKGREYAIAWLRGKPLIPTEFGTGRMWILLYAVKCMLKRHGIGIRLYKLKRQYSISDNTK